MAERSNAAVLNTVEPKGSVGSNPTLSANGNAGGPDLGLISPMTWFDSRRYPQIIVEVGVGTQGGLISLSAPDQRSRPGSTPGTSTITKYLYVHSRV